MATTRMKTVGADLGTGTTTVYTAPVGKDVVIVTLRAANIGSVAATHDISIAGHPICKNTPLGLGEIAIHAEDGTLFLLPGEMITGKASVAATVHVTASIIERDALPS